MKGQWFFVLLCLSLFGELVLGSIFPPTPDTKPLPENVSTLQQEVSWPLETLVTKPEVTVEEVKINARDFYMEPTQGNSESSQKLTGIPQEIIVVNTAEQKSVGEVTTINNSDMDTKTKFSKDVN